MLDLDFIEACYDPSIDDRDWPRTLAETFAPLVPGATRVMAAPYRVSLRDGLSYGEISGDARYMDDERNRAETLFRRDVVNSAGDRQQKLRPFTNSRPSVYAVSELMPVRQAPLRESMPWPEGDILGVFGTLDGAGGFILGPSGPQSLKPPARQRDKLNRLSEHLAIACWLRQARSRGTLASSVDAVFAPDGASLHRNTQSELSAPRHARLVDAVRALDRARCRRRKRSPGEATELWCGLVDGQYAIVESFERDGRRLILGVKCRSPQPLLTAREAAVAHGAARGLANKRIGDQLGIAPGTVAIHLRTALRKLTCPNRRALAQWLQAPADAASR